MASLQKLASIPSLTQLYRSGQLAASPNTNLAQAVQSLNDKICTVRYDITKLEIDAIVNAANKRLLGGGGVDGAIHYAAGPGLLRECRTLGGCNTGSAKITDAYDLPCKKVIHAVGPIYDSPEESEPLLRGCYRTSLQLAVANDCRSIAFSAISTGIYDYPSDEAAVTALDEVRKFLEQPDGDKIDKVVFCNFMPKDVAAYAGAMPEVFPATDEDKTQTVQDAESQGSQIKLETAANAWNEVESVLQLSSVSLATLENAMAATEGCSAQNSAPKHHELSKSGVVAQGESDKANSSHAQELSNPRTGRADVQSGHCNGGHKSGALEQIAFPSSDPRFEPGAFVRFNPSNGEAVERGTLALVTQPTDETSDPAVHVRVTQSPADATIEPAAPARLTHSSNDETIERRSMALVTHSEDQTAESATRDQISDPTLVQKGSGLGDVAQERSTVGGESKDINFGTESYVDSPSPETIVAPARAVPTKKGKTGKVTSVGCGCSRQIHHDLLETHGEAMKFTQSGEKSNDSQDVMQELGNKIDELKVT